MGDVLSFGTVGDAIQDLETHLSANELQSVMICFVDKLGDAGITFGGSEDLKLEDVVYFHEFFERMEKEYREAMFD